MSLFILKNEMEILLVFPQSFVFILVLLYDFEMYLRIFPLQKRWTYEKIYRIIKMGFY